MLCFHAQNTRLLDITYVHNHLASEGNDACIEKPKGNSDFSWSTQICTSWTETCVPVAEVGVSPPGFGMKHGHCNTSSRQLRFSMEIPRP